MARLNIFDITFTRKQNIQVKRYKATVYATNEVEAYHLLKQDCQDFWASLELNSAPDRGFLTQGRRYNPKARVAKVVAH